MAENPIFEINARVASRREQGADIVMLTAGEPQMPTAAEVVAAAQRTLADEHAHHYGSAAGDPRLRRAVAATLPGAGAWNEDEVLITSGAKHALYLAVRAVTGPGDEVLIIEPGWPGHAAAAQATGAVAVTVRADEDLRVTAATLDARRTTRTRAVILASPANPTGAVLPATVLTGIAEWAAAAGVWVISDDVYAAFDYSGTYAHVLEVAPWARDRTLVVSSVSKQHAMTGWRVGWLAGPPEVVRLAREHLAATITNVPLAMQAAATAALRDTVTPAAAKAQYRERRDRLVAALNDMPGVYCPSPDGGMFVFPSVRDVLEQHSWNGTGAVAAHLLDAGVAIVPGEAFNAPDRLRICYAVDDATLDAAIHRLQVGFASLALQDALS